MNETNTWPRIGRGFCQFKLDTELAVMLRKQNKFRGFFAKSPTLSVEGCGFFFSFQIILMNGGEGYFAIPYRIFFSGVFMDFCMKK